MTGLSECAHSQHTELPPPRSRPLALPRPEERRGEVRGKKGKERSHNAASKPTDTGLRSNSLQEVFQVIWLFTSLLTSLLLLTVPRLHPLLDDSERVLRSGEGVNC